MSLFAVITIIVVLLFILFLFLIYGSHTPGKYLLKKTPPRYTRKIIVDFNDCYLISGRTDKKKYIPPSVTTATPLQLLDPELYDQDPHPYNYSTTIVYEKDGKKFYSDGINKDNTTVEYYMMIQKTTFIYLDSNDPGKYLFDISFITR